MQRFHSELLFEFKFSFIVTFSCLLSYFFNCYPPLRVSLLFLVWDSSMASNIHLKSSTSCCRFKKMSITVVDDKGGTVVTVASNCKSVLLLLCQILKNLCYSPVCCSVRKGMMRPSVVSALGVSETEMYLSMCSVKWGS